MRNGLVILAITFFMAFNSASASSNEREIHKKLKSTCEYWKSKYASRKSSTNRTLMNDSCKRADDYGTKHFSQQGQYKYKKAEPHSRTKIITRQNTGTRNDTQSLDDSLRRPNSASKADKLKRQKSLKQDKNRKKK